MTSGCQSDSSAQFRYLLGYMLFGPGYMRADNHPLIADIFINVGYETSMQECCSIQTEMAWGATALSVFHLFWCFLLENIDCPTSHG